MFPLESRFETLVSYSLQYWRDEVQSALMVNASRVTQRNHLNTWSQHSEKLLVVESIDGFTKDELVSRNLHVRSSNGRSEQSTT
jgi:hypothetical protein